MRRLLVLSFALLFDRILGDPPNRWHPVAWMGTLIAFLQRRSPSRGRLFPFLSGLLIAGGGALMVATGGRVIQSIVSKLPAPLSIVLEALLLKMTFSLNGLVQAGRAVQTPLNRGDLESARQQLSWHLVSRDTSQLNEAQVAAAAIESLAENASDGVIAPLFFSVCGGLPLALVYRYLNTADAMLGYRDPQREWLGKAAARLDDLANLLPARLTAWLIILAAPLVGGRMTDAWWIWRRDARKTASPNAGHPMSAAAGALGVELEKVGHYTLGQGQSHPHPDDIDRTIHLLYAVTAFGMFVVYAGCGLGKLMVWMRKQRGLSYDTRAIGRPASRPSCSTDVLKK